MINPAKVLNFFDVFGTWDASLVFVMAGALAVTYVGYRLAALRGRPFAAPAFSAAGSTAVDARLLFGAALFGLGWGLSGLCPGPAIANLATPTFESVAFVAAMTIAMALTTAGMKGRLFLAGKRS